MCPVNVCESDLICDLQCLQTSRQSELKASLHLRDVKGFSCFVYVVKTSLSFRTDQRPVCSSFSKLSCGAGSDKLCKFILVGRISAEITATGLQDDEINITSKSIHLVPVSVLVVL